VTLADEDDNRRVLTLVGEDEADAGAGLISWNAPIARALRGARSVIFGWSACRAASGNMRWSRSTTL
jgi:hypothetical protein